MASQTDSEIKAVLNVVNDVCKILRITKYEPKMVVWVGPSTREKTRFVPSDVVFFPANKILISETIKDVLSAEELRPLITSSIIYAFYSRTIRRELFLRALPSYALLVPFALSLILALTPIVTLWENIVGGVLAIFFATSGFVSGRLISAKYRRKLRLKADTFAAKYIGTESILATLRKIQALHLADLTRVETSSFVRLFSATPSISARLENLAKLSPSALSRPSDPDNLPRDPALSHIGGTTLLAAFLHRGFPG